MIIEDEIQQLAYSTTTNEKTDPIAIQVNRGLDTNYRNQSYKGNKCDYCPQEKTITN